MSFIKLKSWAKINLSLNLIKRLPNNYHSIESLITFVQIFDEIKIESTFKEFYYPFLEKMRKEEERNRRKMPNSAFSRRA